MSRSLKRLLFLSFCTLALAWPVTTQQPSNPLRSSTWWRCARWATRRPSSRWRWSPSACCSARTPPTGRPSAPSSCARTSSTASSPTFPPRTSREHTCLPAPTLPLPRQSTTPPLSIDDLILLLIVVKVLTEYRSLLLLLYLYRMQKKLDLNNPSRSNERYLK